MTYHGHINILDATEIHGRGMGMTVDDDNEYCIGDTFYYGHIYEIKGVERMMFMSNPVQFSKQRTLFVVRKDHKNDKFPLAKTPQEEEYVQVAPHYQMRNVWAAIIIGCILVWLSIFATCS